MYAVINDSFYHPWLSMVWFLLLKLIHYLMLLYTGS